MSDSIQIRVDAYRYLGNREHFRPELERKLSEKGHDSAAIAELIDDLQSEGLFCERRAAEAYLRSRMERGYGPLHIAPRLGQRLAEVAIVREVLPQCADFWVSRLQAYLIKRHLSAVEQPIGDKLMRHCLRRGFPAACIHKAVQNIVNTEV